MLRVKVEVVEHRGSRDKGAESKSERVLPITLEKTFICQEERREECDDNERRKSEGNVGVDADTKKESGKKKIAQAARPEAFEEKIERESEKKSHHDRPKTNPGEIYRPIGGGEQEGCDYGVDASGKEFMSEQINPEYGQRSEHDRPKLQDRDGISKIFNCESLKINEQTFATVVVRVEKSIITGLISEERIRAVGCFVGIESSGQGVEVIRSDKEREHEDSKQHIRSYAIGPSSLGVSYAVQHFVFVFLPAKIIANGFGKRKERNNATWYVESG